MESDEHRGGSESDRWRDDARVTRQHFRSAIPPNTRRVGLRARATGLSLASISCRRNGLGRLRGAKGGGARGRSYCADAQRASRISGRRFVRDAPWLPGRAARSPRQPQMAEGVMDQYETSAPADAGRSGHAVVEQAKDQVQEVAQRAQDAAGNAQVKVRDQIDQRSTQVGEQVAASALALRAGADELLKQGNQSAADAAQRTAAQAERFGSYLQEADANRILADVEDVARRIRWRSSSAGSSSARPPRGSSRRRARVATQRAGRVGARRTAPRHEQRGAAWPVDRRAAQAVVGADRHARAAGAGSREGRDGAEGEARRRGLGLIGVRGVVALAAVGALRRR